MNKKLIQALQSHGFKRGESSESLFFTCGIQSEDKKNVINSILPNHFKPSYDYRSLFIGKCHWSAGGMGYYATSNIRGVFRGYHCKNSTNDYDAGNIFASGKTLAECVKNFLDVYRRLEYNKS